MLRMAYRHYCILVQRIGSGRPGLLTKIGVYIFLDPRKEGAALNERAKRNASCRVSVFDIEGVDYLLYQAPKPNYALIRASILPRMLTFLCRMRV